MLTFTSFTPAVPTGVSNVICVSLATIKLVAELPPNVTPVTPPRLVPRMVTNVPATSNPELGVIEAIVGTASTYLNPPDLDMFGDPLMDTTTS